MTEKEKGTKGLTGPQEFPNYKTNDAAVEVRVTGVSRDLERWRCFAYGVRKSNDRVGRCDSIHRHGMTGTTEVITLTGYC